MSDHLKFPKLRWPLDLRIEKLAGQEVLIVRCPLGISEEPLLLVAAVAPIVASFEGRLSVDEIHKQYAEHGLKREIITELVDLLDQKLFLASPRFYIAEKKIKEDFLASPLRPASLAGSGYARDAKALKKEIDSHLEVVAPQFQARPAQLLGLVAPHIDYRRGAHTYAQAYTHLKYEEHDLYVLIGTSHQYSKLMFHLTLKDFANPLGTLPCDQDFVKKLAALYGFQRSFADEILHRREHSLELQVPFLRRVAKNPKIVPILVGSFHHMLGSGRPPSSYDQYDNFVEALAQCVKERISQGQKVLFVAGVDMAHVGRYFGDKGQLTPEILKQIEKRDQLYLDCISRQDKLGLFTHIEEDQDARRICGFPTMYTVLDCLDKVGLRYEARLFGYKQAVDYDNDCAVTFAAMGMYSAA